MEKDILVKNTKIIKNHIFTKSIKIDPSLIFQWNRQKSDI